MGFVSETKKRTTVCEVRDYLRKVKLSATAMLLEVGFTIEEIGKILEVPESSVRSFVKEIGYDEEVEET